VRRVFVALLPLMLAGISWAQSPVHFVDQNVKAAVEAELWVTDPTAEDMLGLTSLSVAASDVTSLTGLEYAVNLRSLSCTHGRIRDLSPLSGLHELESLALNTNEVSDLSPLSGLSNLRDLNIHDNEISNLSPLSGLSNLAWLDMHANQISDLSALSGLANLDTLNFEGNQISDISPLSSLDALSCLRLGCNEISNLSPVSGLSNLDTLSIYANLISDLSPLSGMSSLRSLVLCGNQISDIAPLSSLTSLDYLDIANNPLSGDACTQYIPEILANNPGISLRYDPCVSRRLSISATSGGSVIHPGEGQFGYEEDATVRLEAQADPGFVFVGFSGTYESTENPAFVTMDRDHVIQANFASAFDVIHVDDNGPGDWDPCSIRMSDPKENGTREHPFDSLQEAINVAPAGATIFVHAGTYHESIDLAGKSIELTGFDPQTPSDAAWPVLDGGGTEPIISFTHGETPDCLLTGLVIAGGDAPAVGAIRCIASSPTIANCLIVGNRATSSDGAVIHCSDSHAAFINCTVADNYAGTGGAALCLRNSPVTVVNSIFWGNTPAQIRSTDVVRPLVSYCNVAGGWPGAGNLSDDPLFALAGHWADRFDLTTMVKPDNRDAVWVMGDYHLQAQVGRGDPEARRWQQDRTMSPCIDAGDPTPPTGREPSPHGGIINLGAYGGTAEAGKSASGSP